MIRSNPSGRRKVLLAAAALSILIASLAISACGSSSSDSGDGTLAAADGCSQTSTDGNLTVVPIDIEPYKTDSSPEGYFAIAYVCVGDSKNPLPFKIDTGASNTLFTPAAAKEAGLKTTEGDFSAGANCLIETRNAKLSGWSLAGMPLPETTVHVAKSPEVEVGGITPVGLLGSDVLSRFGAFRVDYEGSRAVFTTIAPGEKIDPEALDDLAGGSPELKAPMDVQSEQGSVTMTVPVRFGSGPQLKMSPDTGATWTIASSKVAKQQNLEPTGDTDKVGTACGSTKVTFYESGDWTLAGSDLPAQEIGTTEGLVGIDGLLGADVMEHYGTVTFDYAGGQLLLGTG